MKWILYYFTNKESKLSTIIDSFFSQVGGLDFVLHSNCKEKEIKVHIDKIQMPHYYKAMIYAWLNFKETVQKKTGFQNIQIEKESLWFNSNIKNRNGNVLLFF